MRWFASMHKVLFVFVAKSFWLLIFLISVGSLLKSFAASFLKVLDAVEDSMSGAQLALRLLALFFSNMSIYTGFC